MAHRISCLADYRALRQSFRWRSPEFFNFGFDVVDRWAGSHPDRVALRWVGPNAEREVTFAEMAARTNRVAQGLIGLGLERGDRILVVLPRLVEWWESLVGIFKAGLVAIPGTTLLTGKDIAYRLHAADVAAVITDETGAAKLDDMTEKLTKLKHKIVVAGTALPGWRTYESCLAAAPPSLDPVKSRSDEPALIFFTSGTTGMPKMVLHTQASYGLGHQVTGQYWLDLCEGDLHWNLSDTGWAKAAWSSLFGPWLCGATLFVQHGHGKFNAADVLHFLSTYPITTLCAAPTIYRLLVQQDLTGFRPRALRHCVAAGEPLNASVISSWRQATGLTIRDGYGQTETVLLCANFPGIDVKPGSMGLPSPGFDLAVIDEAGDRQGAGVEGNVAVRIDPHRPLGLFREYWRNPEATAASFRGGWYVTGDRAYIDAEGYFWFVGRGDDIINSSAYRIGPFEVESALLTHPAVAEAAVVGKPDSLRGEIVKAFVVLAQGHQASEQLVAELQEHVKRTTAPYKYPREIEFLAELPKTVSGKIRRVELRRKP